MTDNTSHDDIVDAVETKLLKAATLAIKAKQMSEDAPNPPNIQYSEKTWGAEIWVTIAGIVISILLTGLLSYGSARLHINTQITRIDGEVQHLKEDVLEMKSNIDNQNDKSNKTTIDSNKTSTIVTNIQRDVEIIVEKVDKFGDIPEKVRAILNNVNNMKADIEKNKDRIFILFSKDSPSYRINERDTALPE